MQGCTGGAFVRSKWFPGLYALLIVLCVGALSAAVSAQPVLVLEDADGTVVSEMTMEDLLAMPQTVVRTGNEFVDGEAEFAGPLARDVLSMLADKETGAQPDAYLFYAVNDYSIEIPADDFARYNVIFALTQNGEAFSLRDKGPIWLIYPMSDHSELQDRIYNDRLIWQLVRVAAK